MTEEQLPVFVERLNSGEVEPEELAKITVDDFRKVLSYLEQRRQVYMKQYIDAILTSRMNLTSYGSFHKQTYSEREIVAELGLVE